VGPPSLDLTLPGLPRLPGPGEELYGSALHATPGGAANAALGLARLGVDACVVWPIGDDFAGRYLASLLAGQGVRWEGPPAEHAPVTVVLPLDGERAMASYQPDDVPSGASVRAVRPDAVVTGPAMRALVPDGARAYLSLSDADARAPWPDDARDAHVLFANEREAQLVTGAADPEQAARQLAAFARTVVVTLGPDGALALSGGRLEHVAAPAVAALDTTGAGDLFVSAYVWAELDGQSPAERLRLAVVYASLSVRAYTAANGAVTRAELLAAAAAAS
jgi:sugar/nucleoside kinase (ribokinase family)